MSARLPLAGFGIGFSWAAAALNGCPATFQVMEYNAEADG